MRIAEKYPKVILTGLILFFTFFFYGTVLWSPDSYLFSVSGDGMKNYFTYADQIKASSYKVSTAMNYPYGESFLYLDCQPALTVVLKWLPFLQNYSVGIVNLLLIASFGITAWLLYLILVRFSVRPFLAVIAAFSIAVLSPQIFRMTGHLALGYSFFIPLSWYIYLRFCDSEKKWKWSLGMCCNTLFWFFVHAYLGMIIVTFIATMFAVDTIIRFFKKQLNWQFIGQACVQTLIPLVFFWGYATLSDTHTGRTKNPYGYMESTSNFDSVFLPNTQPLKPLLESLMKIEQTWEGLAYIGAGSVVGILLLLGFWLYRLVRYRRFSLTENGHSNELIVAVLASVLILLLAFGYPFEWKPGLLDRFSIIKNFRGIGRFAWVFYFVATTGVIVVVSKRFSKPGKPFFSLVITTLIACSFVLEGVTYHKMIAEQVDKTPNYFDREQLDNDWKKMLSTVDFSNYQAIIPLPFYHIGSENFGKEGTDKIYRISMLLGYHSNLPLVSNYSTRTSIWESKNVMQVISPVFYKKAIEKDIKDTRPFIIVFSNEELLECEGDVLSRGKEIYKNKDFTLLEISKNELFSTNTTRWFEAFSEKEVQMTAKGDFLLSTTDTSSYLYFTSYDSIPNPIAFSGKGALSTRKKDFTPLKKFGEGELKNNTDYIASFWLYNNGPNYGQDIPNGLFVYQVNYEDGSLEWVKVENISAGLNVNGDWSLIELRFTVTDAAKTSELFLKGDDKSKITWNIDDFCIREATVDVYRVLSHQNDQPTKLFMNNHRIIKN